jgi:osmoprotectant transport system permease protein
MGSAAWHEQLALLPHLLTAHLQLSMWALLLGTSISIPLGIVLSRRPRLQRTVLSLVSLVQTVPSLALLAMMVPALAMLAPLTARFGIKISSIGYLPALLALVAYSLLPILRNTVTGLAAVDPALRQAARSVGMTPWQCLWRVELPQALPILAGGVRTATVWVVGMAVLSTPVGAPSLGNYIFSGLQTANYVAIYVGCAAAAGLALGLDALLFGIERGLAGERPRLLRLSLAAVALLYGGLVGLSLRPHPGHGGAAGALRIGAKTFTEQYILAEIVAQQIHRQTGRPTEVVSSLGSTMAYEALRGGEIDAYVDYTGALWKTQLHTPLPREPAAVRAQLEAFLRAHGGVDVLAPLGFANAYALAMPRAAAAADHLVSIGDLAAVSHQKRIAGDYEIFERDEWRDLVRSYGLQFGEPRSMDPALMIDALLNGEVDVVTAYSSDGRLQQNDLVLLTDPHHSLPPYDALLLGGPRLQAEPAVRGALLALRNSISLGCMQRLNYVVDHDKRSPAEAARLFFGGLCKAL